MTTQSRVPVVGSSSSLPPGPPDDRRVAAEPTGRSRSSSLGFLASRVLVLGVVAALALYLMPPLIADRSWVLLAMFVVAAIAVTYLYLSPRHIPAKYLVPGTIFLILFQIFPVILTVSTAFTNFSDGHRGSKADAIRAIQTSSVVEVPGSPEYLLTPATKNGDLVFLLVDPDSKAVQVGTADGLTALPGATVGVTGRVLTAPGYDVLTVGEAAGRGQEISDFSVPTGSGLIKANGLSRAVEGAIVRLYDGGCDCIRDSSTGQVWTADPAKGSFVAPDGTVLAQGWKVNVGLANFRKAVSEPTVFKHLTTVFIWNVGFAAGSVLMTFVLGILVALALHGRRIRGLPIYRVLLVLPYAMPSFAMLLVWRDMFNTDFGLLNRVLGTDVDWIGGPWTARIALILVNTWLGFPYMFLVATGALQAIPSELTEAATVDGASAWQRFRAVTLPLLLVALTPLLIASFAFNFNNFNAIRLVTNGGPFAIDNNTVGATDLLISYTYRVAGFDAGTADYGLAAVFSIFIFIIVATISVVAFRRTRAQEDTFS